jgi:hypothetical protein
MTLNLFTRLSQSVSKLNKIEQQGVIKANPVYLRISALKSIDFSDYPLSRP